MTVHPPSLPSGAAPLPLICPTGTGHPLIPIPRGLGTPLGSHEGGSGYPPTLPVHSGDCPPHTSGPGGLPTHQSAFRGVLPSPMPFPSRLGPPPQPALPRKCLPSLVPGSQPIPKGGIPIPCPCSKGPTHPPSLLLGDCLQAIPTQ